MKQDIVLAGVGGQGILTLATAVDRAALRTGLNMKQSEVHGMAQRGGAVTAHLRISDRRIWSDLIPRGGADVLLSLEPLEALRQLGAVTPGGVIVSNTNPIANIAEYPDLDGLVNELNQLPGTVLLDADAIAREAGHVRSANMVMLGALSVFLQVDTGALRDVVQELFAAKGAQTVDVNQRAFDEGRAVATAAAK